MRSRVQEEGQNELREAPGRKSARTPMAGPRAQRPGRNRFCVWAPVVCVLGVSMVIAGIAALAETPAQATTGSPGLPPPEEPMPLAWGHPLVGRNYVYAVEGRARLISGVLDIEGDTEGEPSLRALKKGPPRGPEWFYGEFEMDLYMNGKPTKVILDLFPFRYIGRHHVRASLVTRSSVTALHPDGIPIGHITFTVEKPIREVKTEREVPTYTRASFTFNGGGPYEIEFKRAPWTGPPPTKLPKARRLWK